MNEPNDNQAPRRAALDLPTLRAKLEDSRGREYWRSLEAVRDGRVRPGDNLIMVGFGAGLTWGALALQWVEPLRPVTTARRRRRSVLIGLAHIRSFFRRVWRRIEGLLWGGRARPAA